MKGRLALGAWCAALALVVWLLTIAGTGDLATPPAPWRWGTWLERVDAAAAVVALVRMVALVAAWYLVLVTIVGALGRRRDATAFVCVADRATPGFVRALLSSAGGLTMSAAGLTVAVSPLLGPADLARVHPPGVEAASALSPAPHAAQIAAPAVLLGRVQLGTDEGVARATLRRVNPGIDPGPVEGEPAAATLRRYTFDFAAGSGLVVSDLADDRVLDDAAAADVWTVEAGDHLWHIAQDTLRASWERTPDEQEVAAYWTVLVQHNRRRLVAATNPDLIYPGQVFELPPIPADPRG